MSEWKECKLGDMAQLQKDSWKVGNDKLLYIGLEHIVENGLRLNGIGNSDDVASNKYYFDSGCFLFGKLRPYFRKLYRPNFKGICSTDIWVVKPKNDNDKDFLFYFFANKEFVDFSYSGSSGTRMPRADWKFVSESLWNFPQPEEQKAIASVLSSLDDKIDLLHRQNKTLEAMAETLFRQWFVEEAEEDWEERPLGEILIIASSKRIFYKEYVEKGVPFYRSKEIIELSKGLAASTNLYISEQRYNDIHSKYGSPKEGDVLVTSVGTLGISYRVRKGDKFYFKDGNLTWFKDFKELPSSIIYCWLNSSVGKIELKNVTIGSTQPALTISGLKEIKVKIPPIEIVKKLDTELNAIYNKVEFNIWQVQLLKKLRDTLLPKLMSGEVRVNFN